MTSVQWDAVRERLRASLNGLPDRGIVIVGEPVAPERPRQGLLRRRPERPPVRYVQFRRSGEYVACECVGAASFGGDVALSSEQDAAIRALGWRVPTDGSDAEPAPSYPNYHRTVRMDEVDEAARLGVGALAALGLQPGQVRWERGP